MTAAALTHATRTNLEKLTKAFALRDAKGREIGGAFTIDQVTYTPAPEGATWGYHNAPGTVIYGYPQATRDGQRYGASQREVEYPTIDAARAAAATYFAKAAKRAGHR